MVYGDNKPFNVALVVANVPAVKKWAEEQKMTSRVVADALLKDEKVRSLFRREIEKYGAAFKGFESIQDFALIGEDFTTDNGMLTPSMKLKRRKVIETHGALLEALYAKRPEKRQQPAAARA